MSATAAVQVLIGTESDDTFSEEMRPYLKKITDAGLRESLALVRELEGDPRAEIEVIRAHVGLAQLHDAAGEPVLALASLRKATALAERLADRDPRSIQSRAMRATVLHRASTLLPDTGERRSALRRSTDILQVLLAENPDGDRRSWHRLVAINHYNDGHSLFGLGRFPEAIAAFRAARVAYNELLADGAPEPDDRFLAARNLLFLCRAHGERFDHAMEAGHEALAVFQKLVAEHADSFEYAYQLYLAQSEIGMKGAGAANWELAIRSFESARHALKVQAATWGKLVSRMARIQEALVETDYNLFFAYDSDPVQFAGPMREISRELFDVCEKLSVLQAPSWNLRIAHAQSCLSQAGYQHDDGLPLDLDLLRKAERLWDGIHNQGPTYLEARRDLLIVRRKIAEALEARGRNDEAKEWLRQSLRPARRYPEIFYEVAMGYAKEAGLVGRLPTTLDARQLQSRRLRLRAEAIMMLRESVADGFHDASRLANERLFEPLKGIPEFGQIILDLGFPANPFATN